LANSPISWARRTLEKLSADVSVRFIVSVALVGRDRGASVPGAAISVVVGAAEVVAGARAAPDRPPCPEVPHGAQTTASTTETTSLRRLRPRVRRPIAWCTSMWPP
jgi:hypothetical protein